MSTLSALQPGQGKGCHDSFPSCQGSQRTSDLGHQVGESWVPFLQGTFYVMGPGPWLVLAGSPLCWETHAVPLAASVGSDPLPSSQYPFRSGHHRYEERSSEVIVFYHLASCWHHWHKQVCQSIVLNRGQANLGKVIFFKYCQL